MREIEDLQWVRFLYAYPNRVTQKLLDTLASHPRIARYMDMPLQHASRNVLARMKRGSHGDAFLKLLERVRATIPGVSLRTSFIVGFPGETEADFDELCDFVRAAKLDWMGVFEYSDVDNAASYPLSDKVEAGTITDRRNRLMAIQKKISRENLRAKNGTTAVALVEGPSKDNPLVWEARLEGMAPEIDGKLYLTDIEAAGGRLRSRRRGASRDHEDRRLRLDRPRGRNSSAAARVAKLGVGATIFHGKTIQSSS